MPRLWLRVWARREILSATSTCDGFRKQCGSARLGFDEGASKPTRTQPHQSATVKKPRSPEFGKPETIFPAL